MTVIDTLAAPPAAASMDWLRALATPCHVFDPERVLARHAALRAALGTQLVVSLKANSNADLFVRCGHAFEDGIELASQGELDIVVGRGKNVKYLNNPALGEDFIRAGIASRCRFILDNLDVTRRFIALAAGKPNQEALLRLNAADLVGAAAPKTWHNHFGMSADEALLAAQLLAAAGIRLVGLHAFAGSGSFRADAEPGRAAQSADIAFALARLAGQLCEVVRAPVTFLNLGGGFPEQGLDPAALRRHRERLAPLAAHHVLAHESGRAIFADAGIFVTRVTALKQRADGLVAICDGGMSHDFLLARTESPLKHWRAPRVVPRTAAEPAADTLQSQPVSFVGNTCNAADVIGRLPAPCWPPRLGDLVVFEQCGAYHASYTVAGFLSHKPARVYIRQA